METDAKQSSTFLRCRLILFPSSVSLDILGNPAMQVPVTQREEGIRKKKEAVIAEGRGGLESNKPSKRKRLPLPIYSLWSKGERSIFFIPQITNPQILGLIPQISSVRHSANHKSANLSWLIRKSQIRIFPWCSKIAKPQLCKKKAVFRSRSGLFCR